MKKILYSLIIVLSFAACSIDSTYKQQYTTVASFEYSNIDYGTQFGADSTFYDSQGRIGLAWGDLAFYHKVEETGSFTGGFMLSYLKPSGSGDKVEGYVPNKYRVVGPEVAATNRTYAVFYQNPDPTAMPTHDLGFLSSAYGTCSLTCCWVNNSEAVFEAVKTLDKPMVKLRATGYLNKEETGSTEIALVADTTMYNWTMFNLAPLGYVDAVDFELITSHSSIPTYFCMDQLVASIKIEY